MTSSPVAMLQLRMHAPSGPDIMPAMTASLVVPG